MAQRGGGGGGGGTPLGSLKTVAVPRPAGLERYVRDETALVALGKALFWDQQAGSDGKTACASCHFHAGADHRVQNQVAATPNSVLTAADFPFHQLANPGNNQSAVLRDVRQVAGSAGVVERSFAGIVASSAAEEYRAVASKAALSGFATRRVTGRNTPSVINAVFNVRNFWDGRARSVFTGATPFGDSDRAANAVAYRNGQLQAETVRMDNASLASQAVGPALNDTEMSYVGRSWADLGRKLLQLTPLGRQQVDATDSVLGAMAKANGRGLAYSYGELIQAAFDPAYWSSPEGNQLETNFSLFWGLAIQAYEATLVSNDSRLDQFLEGRTTALTALEQQGLRVFQAGNSQCLNCHNGPETSAAAITNVRRVGLNTTDPDNVGFFRIGASPLAEDLGFGGTDGFGVPLFLANRAGAADGTFKAPSLRNVELTGPYFHNGSQATLEQVVQFYARNGDFPAGGNLGPGIGRIRLSAADQTALVAFLKSLTDDRVRYERAPFDHPSLCVPAGHSEAADPAEPALTAVDKWMLVPAVGRTGGAALASFDDLLRTGTADATAACAVP